MSEKNKSNGHNAHRQRHCVVSRVLRAIAARFGVSRGMVIAGFVIGFVFAPMLAVLVFLGAWLWSTDEQRYERMALDGVDRARRGLRSAFGGPVAPEPAAAHAAPSAEVDFPDLRRQFDDLERRTAGMEEWVTSEERTLSGEFRRMDEPR